MDIGMPYWLPVNAKIGILITNITDPENPSVIKNFQAEGMLVSSRLTGGRLHVISQFFPDIPIIDVWYDGSKEAREDTYNKNKQKLDAVALEDFIPSFEEYDSAGVMTDSGRLVATEDFLRPEDPEGGSIVSILSLDMDNPAGEIQRIGFVADVHHIYASPQNLYLVSTEYNPMFMLAAEADTYENTTRIYKFDLTTPNVKYTAEGSVPGRILDQFSLGEYDDVLRIATSTGYTWDGSSKNHVFCLKSNNTTLEIIGRLEGLAPGERLYASRFIGDKGFLVTFVAIDPLFTLDLSDPRNPKVAGELKVPGYSTYVHPLKENYLLTIGKDIIVDGNSTWYQGLQISLFDISDFAQPKLIAVEKIGDRSTESETLYNHKAFTFRATDNMFALPVNLYEHSFPSAVPWEYGTQTFYGLYVYQITDENQFQYSGRMNMADEDTYFYPEWLRGIFIDQSIYAVSEHTIKTANIESIKQITGSIDLTP